MVTRYHGAGVYAVPKHQAADVAGNGFIVVSVNSHPIPNDREPEFYGALSTGKLADYRTFGRIWDTWVYPLKDAYAMTP